MTPSADRNPLPRPLPTDDPVVQDILGAAMAEFAQLGLGGARVDAIAAQTKTSKRMIYYHFGSKEGLYRAVLDHAFRSARFREDSFDPGLGSPLEALTRFAEDAFDTFASRPDFVRLLTMENLGGAVYIKNSSLISRLNQRGFKHIESIVRRGKEDGTMRSDITPLDVYINLVGMCYYHAANRAGYLASFKGRLNEEIASEAFHASRKRAVIESVTRYAQVRI